MLLLFCLPARVAFNTLAAALNLCQLVAHHVHAGDTLWDKLVARMRHGIIMRMLCGGRGGAKVDAEVAAKQP